MKICGAVSSSRRGIFHVGFTHEHLYQFVSHTWPFDRLVSAVAEDYANEIWLLHGCVVCIGRILL